MPANLPPQYYEEEKRLRSARTPEEKADILETLLRLIPKHKGTEKLQADLKRRLSKARGKQGKKSGGSRKGDEHHVEKEGAGQVVLAGLPNVGKSQILDSLTKATPQIAEYPYSTLKPLSGMGLFENVRVQLVDIPPLLWEVTDSWVANILRNADAICLVVELVDDPVGQVEILLEEMEQKKVPVLRRGEAPGEPVGGIHPKRLFMAGTKLDLPGADEGAEALKAAFDASYDVVNIAVRDGVGTDAFLAAAFHVLDKVRVYTKTPGKKPDLDSPFVFRKGTTVIEMAREIHKDFAKSYKTARIYSEDKYNGQRVGKDFELRDGDIIELVV
jgi:ribosome-interacting GTPase 1